ncbi:transglutaminase-like domain-containing protein [Lignipirellula cremea]|uniref:Transglutaminase-like superfamily protein n=1 Tax=Lignipirellula cremea TaxID=2528010 RepID=A0A518DX12_9BACT|nr:transglutaminase domain-containing protein [Lignipirellula cremea]QDU96375.1 Transglutaminase-like superfamily protein [Lignipirellula cremea]
MRVRLTVGSLLLMLLGWCGHVTAAEPDASPLDPHQAYQARRLDPVTYEVDFTVVVTAPYHTKKLKVWLPLPTTDAAQEVKGSKLTTFPTRVEPQIGTEPVFGNRFAYFEFDHPQGGQLIRHRFQVKVWELRWDIDPQKVQAVDEWPTAFAPYLRGEGQAVVVNEGVTQLLDKIVPQRTSGYQDLSTVMQWVDSNFIYDHGKSSLQASSVHALETRRGHCSDYHGFCAAMGRALGYPARVTYGINPFPKNSPSHCKLEVFLPPYGWVSFDVSETQKLAALIREDGSLSDESRQELLRSASRRLLSGYRDNTWFLQTRGSDYDLVPAASQKVAVIRTIYAEADGEPLPEPDPAAADQREFSWMTIHKYVPDREIVYPFKNWSRLASPSQANPPAVDADHQ